MQDWINLSLLPVYLNLSKTIISELFIAYWMIHSLLQNMIISTITTSLGIGYFMLHNEMGLKHKTFLVQ